VIGKLLMVVPVLLPLDNPTAGSFKMQETWKDIEGYEGRYQVSDLGRVKSIKRNVWYYNYNAKKRAQMAKPECVLRTSMIQGGYLQIGLYANGTKRKRGSIHRLVRKAFIPNPENKPCINHLAWSTYSENNKHALDTGLATVLRGELKSESKLNEFQVRVIRKTTGLYQRELAEIFNVSPTTICDIRNYTSWKHI